LSIFEVAKVADYEQSASLTLIIKSSFAFRFGRAPFSEFYEGEARDEKMWLNPKPK